MNETFFFKLDGVINNPDEKEVREWVERTLNVLLAGGLTEGKYQFSLIARKFPEEN